MAGNMNAAVSDSKVMFKLKMSKSHEARLISALQNDFQMLFRSQK